MPCFCKATPLPAMPSAHMSVHFVPPQLRDVLGLLPLPSLQEPRIDARLGQALPPGGPAWINASLAAQAPHITLPPVLPPGGGMLMSMMMRLSASARVFPLAQPKRLLAELIQSVNSLMMNMVPRLQPLSLVPPLQLQRLALAARLTLAMRAQGVCPMVIANVDASVGPYAGSRSTMTAAMSFAARMPSLRVPPFGLPLPQLKLAQNLAGFAALSDGASNTGLPPLAHKEFLKALRSQLNMLAKMPMPNLAMTPAALMALAGQLADLDAIHEAFGENALTPAGIARVNAMLRYFAKLGIPLPDLALNLKEMLDMTPALPDVLKGLETVQSSGGAIAASMQASLSTNISVPPMISMLEALAALAGILTKGLKVPPFGPCGACELPFDQVASSMPKVPLPDPPVLPKIPQPSGFF